MKRLSLSVALLVSVLVVPIAANAAQTAPNVYRARMAASNEVPPAAADAVGAAVFKSKGDTIKFKVTAHRVTGPVLGAHIHTGDAGVNGPVVVSLCGNPPVAAKPACHTKKSGKVRFQGLITPDLAAAWGTSVDDLLSAMQTGGVYINLHTAANPGGELRGQIEP